MNDEWLVRFEAGLIGRQCTIKRRESDWAIELGNGDSISLPVPWRIVSEGRIAFADRDDGQWFGLSAPVDGEREANRLIDAQRITEASVHRETADLTIHFDGGSRLEAFNYSAGYEGWQAMLPSRPQGVSWIVALGGGELSIFD